MHWLPSPKPALYLHPQFPPCSRTWAELVLKSRRQCAMSYCFWGFGHPLGWVMGMSRFVLFCSVCLQLSETFSLGFQRDQTKESDYFGTQQHFPTSVPPAETPGISPELRAAVGTSCQQVKGMHGPRWAPPFLAPGGRRVLWPGPPCPAVASRKASAFSPPWARDHPDSKAHSGPQITPWGPPPPLAVPNQ